MIAETGCFTAALQMMVVMMMMMIMMMVMMIIVFAVDTNGGLGKAARSFMKEIVANEEDETRARLVRSGWLAVHMQAVLTRTIVKARELVVVLAATQQDGHDITGLGCIRSFTHFIAMLTSSLLIGWVVL